ncbi:putative bifunctional diguanylate cyclase/phosphodiesterase [Gorillibacterium sp. sgz5001074]|uniref:putative bifunctional diguanylate cyclase/phosphodiesterase n=1 Tax=Gorillibacterium sp. sgz5001074 TaxID=3446695 RepID=UPI003F67A618
MRNRDTEGLENPVEAYYSRMPGAGFIVGRDGGLKSFNRQAASALFGTGELSPDWEDCEHWISADYRDYFRNSVRMAASGQTVKDCRMVLLSRKGDLVSCRLHLFPLDDLGQRVGVDVRQYTVPYPAFRPAGEEPETFAPEKSGQPEPVWAADLPGAWNRGEMALHYQPQWNIETGELIGMEALIRWHHPRLGLIPPLDFIPYAEDTDWIMELGEWVLREAAHQNKRWQDAGFPAVPVSVNCSVKQFGRTNIVGTVFQILKETGLDPQYLKLEITESVAYRQEQDVVRKLHDFQNFQILISIDDFGTGYSSLSYLHEMPVHVIKLDRSFLTGVETNPAKAGVVRCILDLARHLNLKVMAEGLETEAQLDYLKSQGCVEAQGYYMNRPMPVPDIESHWRGESLSAWRNRSRLPM